MGKLGSKCNLHYVDDLPILNTRELEDLRIIKLVLYLFEGLTGLETNLSKTCLYSSKMGELSDMVATKTLNCAVALLPVLYLGIPILGRRPLRQD